MLKMIYLLFMVLYMLSTRAANHFQHKVNLPEVTHIVVHKINITYHDLDLARLGHDFHFKVAEGCLSKVNDKVQVTIAASAFNKQPREAFFSKKQRSFVLHGLDSSDQKIPLMLSIINQFTGKSRYFIPVIAGRSTINASEFADKVAVDSFCHPSFSIKGTIKAKSLAKAQGGRYLFSFNLYTHNRSNLMRFRHSDYIVSIAG